MPDVMFPGGSAELMEPIYKNPLLSAPFNEQLALIAVDYVSDRLKVRFLPKLRDRRPLQCILMPPFML